MTPISRTITEEARRFETAFGHKPDYVFIGNKQDEEIEAMVNEMRQWGLLRPCDPVPRPTLNGIQIFRVDAADHLSFGVAQPSPCG